MSDPLAPADPADPAVPEAGDRSPVSSADVDTQFDLDLSAELEQYPDPSWAPAAGTDPAAVPTEVAAAIDPPTSVHSVFVTPPAGTAVVVPPAPVPTPVAPPVGPGPRGGRRAGRRVLVGFGAVALAASLVAVGAGLALALSGADDAASSSPGGAVALPADPDAPKPADEPAAAAPDAAADAVDPDPDGAVQAAAAVDAFLAVRGTEDERAVSSAAGRAELDAVIGSIGRSVPLADPTCTTGPATGTFTCVLPTDQGDLAFTVGPDVDDPATSGFEVIGAAIA